MKNLILDYEHRDIAKKFGCKWNPVEKCWQIENDKYFQWHDFYQEQKKMKMEKKFNMSFKERFQENMLLKKNKKI